MFERKDIMTDVIADAITDTPSEFATIINNFGNQFIVPMWKAEQMFFNKELKSFTPVDVESSHNTEPPQTKAQFDEVIKS